MSAIGYLFIGNEVLPYVDGSECQAAPIGSFYFATEAPYRVKPWCKKVPASFSLNGRWIEADVSEIPPEIRAKALLLT